MPSLIQIVSTRHSDEGRTIPNSRVPAKSTRKTHIVSSPMVVVVNRVSLGTHCIQDLYQAFHIIDSCELLNWSMDRIFLPFIKHQSMTTLALVLQRKSAVVSSLGSSHRSGWHIERRCHS
ncbi:hypothetical protein NE237_028624 [Protea cynaroides]|uniref:Uncharacterized protein n=1 Tax=Protea cynaroides TaxID=273540 RepID=A0A9Q0GTM1_9MAGN|nr:hypothetical protein NE237_028624 [Protea cynaroides]